jgi:hypothetical protein
VTNSGKNVEKFLEDNVADAGFAVYASTVNPEQPVVEKKPQITDPDVDFSEVGGVITYSRNGKPFAEVTIIYDEDKKTIKSKQLKRLDD